MASGGSATVIAANGWHFFGPAQVAASEALDGQVMVSLSICASSGVDDSWDLRVGTTKVDPFVAGSLSFTTADQWMATLKIGDRVVQRGITSATFTLGAGAVHGAIQTGDPAVDASIDGTYALTCEVADKPDPYFETTFCKQLLPLRP